MQKFRDRELETIRRLMIELGPFSPEARERIITYTLGRMNSAELSDEPLYPVGTAAMPVTTTLDPMGENS